MIYIVSERGKVVDPVDPHRNSEGTIVFVTLAFWIEAALFDIEPTRV